MMTELPPESPISKGRAGENALVRIAEPTDRAAVQA